MGIPGILHVCMFASLHVCIFRVSACLPVCYYYLPYSSLQCRSKVLFTCRSNYLPTYLGTYLSTYGLGQVLASQ